MPSRGISLVGLEPRRLSAERVCGGALTSMHGWHCSNLAAAERDPQVCPLTCDCASVLTQSPRAALAEPVKQTLLPA